MLVDSGPLIGEVGTSSAWSAGVSMTVTPTPTPTPDGSFESWEVSPGLAGFIPVFLIAVACIGLFLSFTRQMRRVAVRQAQRDALDREEDAVGTETEVSDLEPRPQHGVPGK